MSTFEETQTTDGTSALDEIKNSGLKATGPRLKILEIFQTTKERHLSAEDVYRLLLQQESDVGLATVYRVLTQFEQAGLLRRSTFNSDKAIYELELGQHHDHLVCLDCGRVEEFFDPNIEKIQNNIATAKGYHLVDHALSLYGHCIKPDCEHKKQLR